MTKTEKSVLNKFLLLHAGSLIIFLSLIISGGYRYNSQQIHRAERSELRAIVYAFSGAARRGELPSDDVEWIFFDEDGEKLGGNFNLEDMDAVIAEVSQGGENFLMGEDYNYLFFRFPPRFFENFNTEIFDDTNIDFDKDWFFMVRAPIDKETYSRLFWAHAALAIGAFIFFMGVGFFLTRLFLRPLRCAIERMDRFIKDTTHEIATPITAMLMSIEGLSRENLTERDAKRLTRVEAAARSIKAIYDDLAFLLADRASLKERECRLEQVDVGELARERAEFFEPIARARGITIEVLVSDFKKPLTDRGEMSRVLDNLISNAIKYNKQNGIARIVVAGNRVAVEDEGKGVPADDRKRIFTRFTRLDEAQGGFGLGLNIAQLLCERAKMKIAAEDCEGGGARFVVSWD
ncbi:MAG: hypothetical protein LBU73_09180 [Helicobacteraceae bacterium]|jgi:two-component system OmpR family sensor kinase|nr:hypothetical protein [Helicobacteraceae bacterium]